MGNSTLGACVNRYTVDISGRMLLFRQSALATMERSCTSKPDGLSGKRIPLGILRSLGYKLRIEPLNNTVVFAAVQSDQSLSESLFTLPVSGAAMNVGKHKTSL